MQYDKEGGSLDELSINENPYNNMTESSPEISKTDQEPSAYIDGDMPSSSFQDTPMSSHQQIEEDINDPHLVQNLNQKAQQISEHLQRMKMREQQLDQEGSESLSPLQQHEL